LYEMLTGKQAFTGETITDVLAAVVKSEPDWTPVPAKAQRLLRRCLEKDRDRRLCDIRDFELLLDDESASSKAETNRLWPALAALMTVAFAIALWGWWQAKRPVVTGLKPLIRLDVDLGPDVSLGSYSGADVILSPDGSRIAYVSHNRLFTRRLDQLT